MVIDCAIIGGGPAGLQASLVLGRAKRNVVLFDDNKPRNAVTQETHGFLTRDGVKPGEFRNIAHQEISKYPSVAMRTTRITNVSKHEDLFEVVEDNGEVVQAKTIILATGVRETLPEIEGIHDFYGKSLFNCPYCDGWELRDKPLVIIVENEQFAFHMTINIWNWSRNLLVCTNGRSHLTEEQKEVFQKRGIQVIEDPITALVGKDGMLERVVFATHEERAREGGFVAPQWTPASSFGSQLGCELNAMGGVATDELGRATVSGVYAAGDASVFMPSQVIFAAASGSRAAAGVNADLTVKEFEDM